MSQKLLSTRLIALAVAFACPSALSAADLRDQLLEKALVNKCFKSLSQIEQAIAHRHLPSQFRPGTHGFALVIGKGDKATLYRLRNDGGSVTITISSAVDARGLVFTKTTRKVALEDLPLGKDEIKDRRRKLYPAIEQADGEAARVAVVLQHEYANTVKDHEAT